MLYLLCTNAVYQIKQDTGATLCRVYIVIELDVTAYIRCSQVALFSSAATAFYLWCTSRCFSWGSLLSQEKARSTMPTRHRWQQHGLVFIIKLRLFSSTHLGACGKTIQRPENQRTCIQCDRTYQSHTHTHYLFCYSQCGIEANIRTDFRFIVRTWLKVRIHQIPIPKSIHSTLGTVLLYIYIFVFILIAPNPMTGEPQHIYYIVAPNHQSSRAAQT